MRSSQISLWNVRRIALLVLGVIVVTWLPILGAPRDATKTKRARVVGDAPILAFAFAPRGETIATIQMDGRVALRAPAGGGSSVYLLDYTGPAWAVARRGREGTRVCRATH
jgi:hypothetical protein